jgi:hypothetical protein
MGKSAFEKLAKSLGRAAGRLMDKAREAGLDRKAENLAGKANAAVKRWLAKAEEGEGAARGTAAAGSTGESPPEPAEEPRE